MQIPALKSRLRECSVQFGLFCCSYSPQVVEALRPSGFDFLLFDAEHTPGTLTTLHAQLTALAHSGTEAIVRVADVDLAAFKQYLDLGVAGLMVPNIASAEQARTAVSYTRYPPQGVRGIAGSVRATDYGRDRDYTNTAESRISLIVQVESRQGIEQIEAIAAVDGVDAVFFGPHDLAADLGHIGQSTHPEVVAAVEHGIRRVRAAGKPAGVLAGPAESERYLAAGAALVALGSDLGLLVRAADELAARHRPGQRAQQ